MINCLRKRTLIALALAAAICPNVFGKEILTPIKIGKSSIFSYGLYSITTDADLNSTVKYETELLLALRNAGAKFIDLTDVSADDFELRNGQGKLVKLILKEKLRQIGYGGTAVAHLCFEDRGRGGLDTKQPWSLHFKSKPGARLEFDLLISNDGLKTKERSHD